MLTLPADNKMRAPADWDLVPSNLTVKCHPDGRQRGHC